MIYNTPKANNRQEIGRDTFGYTENRMADLPPSGKALIDVELLFPQFVHN